MGLYFFDTCALIGKYVPGPHSRTVRLLVSDPGNHCYIADWTVLEMASSIARNCRRESKEAKKAGIKYDLKRKYDLRDRSFALDIAEERLKVRITNARDILHARELIRFSGVLRANKVGTGDAIIAACCLNLSHELAEKVIFYTADNDLYRVLYNHDHFRAVMCLRFLGILRDPTLPQRTC